MSCCIITNQQTSSPFLDKFCSEAKKGVKSEKGVNNQSERTREDAKKNL